VKKTARAAPAPYPFVKSLVACISPDSLQSKSLTALRAFGTLLIRPKLPAATALVNLAPVRLSCSQPRELDNQNRMCKYERVLWAPKRWAFKTWLKTAD
jgi:hypothetical protein